MTTPEQPPDLRVDLGGLIVTAFSEDALIDRLVALASRPAGEPAAAVCYVNAHIFNLAWCDRGFHETLNRATLLWPDGVSARTAMRIAGAAVPTRLSGLYFIDRFSERLADAGLRQFLLGARPEVVAKSAERLRARFGERLVAGYHDGYFSVNCEEKLIDQINASGADVLTVGMGSPRQERWIVENAARLRPRLLWTVGALLDFIAGRERQAPLWMRSAGLEWLYRLTQDIPGKWRRYLVGNPLFVTRLLACPPRIVREQ